MVEFTWIANYNDGTKLKMFNNDGTENKYPDIDRTKIESFDIMDGNYIVYHLKINPGDVFFYRRIVAKQLIASNLKEINNDHCYKLGIYGEKYFICLKNRSVSMFTNDPMTELFDYEVPCRIGN